ncbi:hypothetical protein FBUS_07941 [Fasciolopsis buskii]|uniref:Uncharacterized protein n=1 Tax=Fasciolopsis buskii TaxID=27845 RepID=A0A8E0S4T1_9TREM|nr:hypothetical protein FBUS_07941 [Fasciolopsis buski]
MIRLVLCQWVRSHFCGLILTQLASQASGARALRTSGLLRRLISDAWRAIEFPQGPNQSVDDVDAYQSALVASSPPNWPIDPIDKCAYKPFINLVKATSSFKAVAFFLLSEQKEEKPSACCYPSFPETLRKFLDRSVVLNKEEKMRSLYNLEQTHTFGLRLLACIVSDLDSMLLLCTKFDLLHVLIQMQLDTFAPNAQGHTSLDALVLERNYLLVKCYFCGGPTERSLPNRFLCEHGTNPYPHPLIVRPPNVDDPAIQTYFISTSKHKLCCDRFPCKSWYEDLFPSPISLRENNSYPTVSKLLAALQQCPYLADRLIDSPESAVCCYEHCHRIMSELANKNTPDYVSLGNDIDTAILLQNCLLLRQYATEIYGAPKFDRLSDDPDSYQATDLTPFEVFGVETAVRYGQRIGVLAHDSLHPLTDSGHVASLTSLLKRVHCGLVQERQRRGTMSLETDPTDSIPYVFHPSSNSAQPQALSDSRGFDWFSVTIFLAFHGDANRAWEFLAQFASDSLSVYIWPHRAQTHNVYCASLLSGGRLPPGLNLEVVITSIYWTLRQPHIGFGMSKYIQHLCFGRIAAFSGALPVCFQRPHPRVIIAERWVKQCFWNYLDWNGIMDYVILCLIHPRPYCHVYFVLAALRHLRRAIRLATAQSPTNQQQQPQQLAVFLQEEPIRGFQPSEHLDFFTILHSKYGEKLNIAIKQHTTPGI